MFWNKNNKKKDKKKDEDKLNIKVNVIPDIFYGGKDPLIYHEQNKKISTNTKQNNLKIKNKNTSLPIISKKKIIIISVIILCLFIGGVSFYYFRQVSDNSENKVVKVVPPAPEKKVEVPKPVVKEPEIVEIPEPVEEVTIPEIKDFQNTIVFPNILLRDSADIDIDSLTDQEEEIFGTDSGIWDSDKDGYYDGQEVFNLYNPKGFAPVKIIDSGLVREYINPNWQYRVYYPTVWDVAGVDTENNHVIFSSITGDFIEIRSFKKMPEENFISWFAKNIEGQSFSDLSSFNNRFVVSGYKRNDSLTAYFTNENSVFVMIYQASGNAVDVPYRHVMQLMYQSFRPSAVFVDLPGQKELPQVSTTGTLP